MENSPARGPARGHQRPRRAASSSSPAQGLPEARRHRPAAPAPPPPRRGTRCGSRRSRRPPPRCRRPSPRAAPRPNDSPSSDGKHATVGAPQPGLLLLVADPPEPLDPRHAPAPERARSGGRRRPPRASASRSSPANASSSTASPLRGSWRPDEQDRRVTARATHRPPRSRPARSPLGRISHSCRTSASPALRPRETAVRTASRRISGWRPGRSVSYQPLRPPGRVERADGGHGRAHRARRGWTRARTARGGAARRGRSSASPRACAGQRVAGGDRRDRSVARHPGAGTDGGDPGLGRRAVARGDDAGVDPELAQGVGEPEHLALDAAEHRQRVRARQHHPHAARSPSPSLDHPHPPPRYVMWPGHPRSLGQFGCSRCQCVGCYPDQVLEAVRELLGDPGDVVADARRVRPGRSGRDVGLLPRRRAEVAAGRQERGTASAAPASRARPATWCARRRTRLRRRRR